MLDLNLTCMNGNVLWNAVVGSGGGSEAVAVATATATAAVTNERRPAPPPPPRPPPPPGACSPPDFTYIHTFIARILF